MISSFRDYLVEEERVVYFSFGRMNPPTIGHEKLLDKLSSVSGKNPYRLYLSQSQDPKKNPLSYKDKIKFARKMFPKHSRSILNSPNIKNVMDIANKLYEEGNRKIVMVVGSDRVSEFQKLLDNYNGKKARHGFYNFEDIRVISAGERDPDSEGVSGMSASKMREAASNNDFVKFSQGLPKNLSNKDSKELFNSVRSGMGLEKVNEFFTKVDLDPVSETREAYVSGDLYSVGDIVSVKETREICEVTHCGTNYLVLQGETRSMRKWIEDVELVEKKEKEDKSTTPQDPDIKSREGSQPASFHRGIKSKSTKAARDRVFKKREKMADDDPRAYKPAPGDVTHKTEPSKYTKKFKQMYGENSAVDTIKKRIEREKTVDKQKHDRMLDRARLSDVRKKNKETK